MAGARRWCLVTRASYLLPSQLLLSPHSSSPEPGPPPGIIYLSLLPSLRFTSWYSLPSSSALTSTSDTFSPSPSHWSSVLKENIEITSSLGAGYVPTRGTLRPEEKDRSYLLSTLDESCLSSLFWKGEKSFFLPMMPHRI